MISRAVLQSLQKHKSYPSITLLAPTHRTAPANQKDRVVVKNLAVEAAERLHAEFKKREVAGLLKALDQLIAKFDWQHAQEGLALFVGGETAEAVMLPFRVKPRLIVDETFATRDLVFTRNRAPRYRVLTLTEKPTRLFEATTNVLEEVTAKPFPMTHTGPGGASRLPGGEGINVSAKRDESHRQFFRKVDDALGKLQKEEPLPLVLVGVVRYLAFFEEVTKHADAIVGVVPGSHDLPEPSALGKLTWPAFKAGSARRRTQALVRLTEAVSLNRHASGLPQVWRAASEKRVQTLLVEEDYEDPADVSPDGAQLLPYTRKGPQALDDAVDDLIENVLAQGGEVFFYEPGTLDLHQKIAATLRY